jgi:acyl-CoA thioesterase
MSDKFADDVVVQKASDGRYRASLDHSWDLWPLPQGGIVASFALRAAMAEVDDPAQKLRTCTAVFAGQVAAGDLEIDVQLLRRGRSASQVLATVRNVGQSAGTTVVAVFGARRKGPSFVDVSPPNVSRPLDCRSYREGPPPGEGPGRTAPFWERVEGRAALGHPPWEHYEPETSEVATWIRFDDPPVTEDGSLDPLGVLTLADRMPGSVGERIGPQEEPWFSPSADLTFHMFEPARTDWLLAHDRARWADDGWASAETTLWDESGNLVAYATQMMLFTFLQERE